MVWLRKDTLVARDIGDEEIIYDPDKKRIHILNKTGLFIWNLCDGQHSTEQIIAEVFRSFSLRSDLNDKTRIEKEIRLFLNQLSQEGLIKCCSRE